MSESLNFWRLIGDNRIEIPVIQRDYAQGRKEDKIEAIRVDFVSDLINAIKIEDSKKQHLGFVYGKINGKDKISEKERNKKAIANILNAVEGYAKHLELKISSKIESFADDDKDLTNLPIFIPLDGQQRITTLYLLHWYLIQFLKDDDFKTHLEILKRFSYKTRKSSAKFCEAISNIENRIIISDEVISESIINSKWFLKIWLNDATVKGMLVMLDEIQSQLSQIEDKKSLFNNLKDEKKGAVLFDFLDLNELNQTDELYVKMNARGQQLSEFEHFKAWLQKLVSEDNIHVENSSWKTELDKSWLDLFWKKKEGFYIDDVIYNAFKQITLFEFLTESLKLENSLDEIESLPEQEIKKRKKENDELRLNTLQYIRGNEYISFHKFKEMKYFNEHTINFIFKIFSLLSNNEKIAKYKSWLKDISCLPFIEDDEPILEYFLKNKKDINQPETVFYYAFLLFIVDQTDSTDEEIDFKKWMRVCRNLIFNTYIQNPKNLIDALTSIKILSKNKRNLYQFLLDENSKVEFFDRDQVGQEILKIKLFQSNDNDWFPKIIEFENHEYFNGNIGFLLNFALDKEKEYIIEDFIYYADRASILYDDKIRNHQENILQRALLCKDDYLPTFVLNHTFCLPKSDSLRARKDNWQRLFNSKEKSIFLKNLIKENLKDINKIENNLIDLINEYNENDWRQFAINCPKVIQVCTEGLIRYEDDGFDIKLLETTRIYGSHAELRSYYFYNNYFKENDNFAPFSKKSYWKNKMSQYEFPCIRFSNWKVDDEEFKLEITFKDRKYLMQFLEVSKNKIYNLSINEYFKNKNWKISEEKYFKEFEGEDDLKINLYQLLIDLQKITP